MIMQHNKIKVFFLILFSPLICPLFLLALILWLLEEGLFRVWLFFTINKKDKENKEEDEEIIKRKKWIKIFLLVLMSPVLWPVYLVFLMVWGLRVLERLLFVMWLYLSPRKILEKRRNLMKEKQDICKDNSGSERLYDRICDIDRRIRKCAIKAGEIQIGHNAEWFTRKKCKSMEETLCSQGFKNVRTIAIDDAGLFRNRKNTIESISINGDKYFKGDEYFTSDAEIIIFYHD